MPGPIFQFLADDHARLGALLTKLSLGRARSTSRRSAPFRELLRPSALEEKILLPAARAARGGEPLPQARRLRVDHGAIAPLLVPTPTSEIAGEIRKILGPHNDVDEGGGRPLRVVRCAPPRRDVRSPRAHASVPAREGRALPGRAARVPDRRASSGCKR